MPFLKPVKASATKLRAEASERNGLRHAIFTPSLCSRRRYTGDWRADKKQGKGLELDEQSCLLYEGDWYKDAKHGFGVLSKILKNKCRRKIYSGYWVNGKKEGFGALWYENGDYYEGGFLANKRHGLGRICWSDGSFYQGTWKNDLQHGEGILILANGNRFEGYFLRGKREGRGIFYHMRTGQLQEGCWIADTCLTSTVEDTYWRQSAAEPTPYPIPKIEVKNFAGLVEAQINEISPLCDSSASSSSRDHRDYTRGKIDCP